MQEKWARSLGVLIRRGGRGATTGSVSNRAWRGKEQERGEVAGGHKIMAHAISASQGWKWSSGVTR